MEETILQIPAKIMKVGTMAHRSLRVIADTQENLTNEQMAKIMGQHEKTGWWCFLPEERAIDALDVVGLPKITWDKDEKSPGQRLRSCLFVYWEQKKPTETFAQFYDQTMEKYINAVKEKLV